MNRLPNYFSLLLLVLSTASLTGQNRLNLFTKCECNLNLIKQELTYVNHTLDPADSQVDLFIVTNRLSNGSRVYNFDFRGQEELKGNQLKFKVPTTAIMTSREIDELIVKRIKIGLAGFLAGTSWADLAEFAITEVPKEAAEETAVVDNWNSWIFDAGVNFFTDQESRRGRTDLGVSFDADRTTPELRVRFGADYLYRTRTVVEDDGTELNSIREDAWSNASVVKSISNHWSIGLFGRASQSTFRNFDYSTWLAPAIEYNFFDYNEVPFKEFTVAYRVGWVYNDYTEETVFFQLNESLARQELNVNLRLRQRWGDVFAGAWGGNFLDDFSKNRVGLNLRTNVRVFKGLSFTARGSYQIINDQISLKRGEASVEDTLLGQAQLATSFDANLRLGVTYTFGSMFNNVVNMRL